MQSKFSLSLCICTRNRPDEIRRCLRAVAEGHLLPDQVLVSDDGDDGNTAEDIVSDFPFVQYQRGPRRGLGANRNACIASAIGHYISFIDDDVVIPRRFVEHASVIYQRNPAWGATTILTGVEFKHATTGILRSEPGNADFWGFQRLPPNGIYRAVVINATIFPAALFRLALFDSQLLYGSEEIDIARHATALGYTIAFDPTLQVDHYPSEINRTEYASVIDASRMYATAKGYWSYEGNALKAIVYGVAAPVKLMVALGRRFGLEGVKNSINATATAYRYAWIAVRRGR